MRIYYRVEGGFIAEKIAEFAALVTAVQKQRQALMVELNANSTYGHERAIVGFSFNDATKVPKCVFHKDGDPENIYRPNLRTKDGRALHYRFRLPYPDCWTFDRLINGPGPVTHSDPCSRTGLAFSLVSFEHLNGVTVIGVPHSEKDPWTPPAGCVELKTSEYIQLQADEAARQEKQKPEAA